LGFLNQEEMEKELKYKTDITNQKFGRLIAIKYSGKINGLYHSWQCKCNCGTVKNFNIYGLLSGATKSCGCVAREMIQNTKKPTVKVESTQTQTIKVENKNLASSLLVSRLNKGTLLDEEKDDIIDILKMRGFNVSRWDTKIQLQKEVIQIIAKIFEDDDIEKFTAVLNIVGKKGVLDLTRDELKSIIEINKAEHKVNNLKQEEKMTSLERIRQRREEMQSRYTGGWIGKKSTDEEIKMYFEKVLELKNSGEEFPVNLDLVYPLVYQHKHKAVEELKENFIEGVDYQVLTQKGENPKGGRPTEIYMLSVSCMEYFVARKVKPVFEVYRKVFHKAVEQVKKSLSQAEFLLQQAQMMVEQEKRMAAMENKINEQEQEVKLLKAKITTDPEFFTIMGYASLIGQRINLENAKSIGKMASTICKEEGIETGSMPDPRFGRVKTYPIEVLEDVFEEYNKIDF
jgi:hypothetical protein